MMTNLCFGLTCLLLPVLIELFNLQASLQISNTGHALVEILILGGIYGFFMQILRLDEWLYLRNYLLQSDVSEPKRRYVGREAQVQPTPIVEQTPIGQTKAATFHWPRLPFENVAKHHRTVKS